MRNHVLGIALIVVSLAALASAEDWPQWRGPHFNGSSQSRDLPDKLDESTRLWSTQLPGGGAGTPVISGDHVFISCLDSQSKKLLGICVARKDGAILWSKEIGVGFKQNNMNDTASPSAVTDGKLVWFMFGTGDLAAFDVNGQEKWSRNLQKEYGPFNIQWIYASSPLLYDNRLYIQVLHRDVPPHGGSSDHPAESYLLALDPQTGKELWRHVRPNDARSESKESYATPIPFENQGRTEILLVGGNVVTAHDPKNGAELWRCGGWNMQQAQDRRIIGSAVGGDGLVFACPPKGEPVFAVKDGGSGDVTSSQLAWRDEQLSSDVCVPLFYKDRLYVLNGDKKEIYCVEPKSGQVQWQGRLGGNAVFRASPTGADDKIYCMNEAGDAWVLSADQFKVLSKSSLGGQRNRASVAVVDGQVFVRAGDKLDSFGRK